MLARTVDEDGHYCFAVEMPVAVTNPAEISYPELPA
jgi:hypothetical protein